ncbi:MAG TPA: hypothetical protein PLO24_06675 [Bacteroidales bacterium]|jgi:hypothetical protein|nr:hypothetical protein [Bacteroidales bacterium]HOS72970.1 hypothetical protein [Bacteroidales bacterium]HQH24611.1 hypothetical protein [Bacteroidales bacterium]HQJ82885.1 hypothetical protein [Bacteroidales bacterium]
MNTVNKADISLTAALFAVLLFSSCINTRSSYTSPDEDRLMITRRYAGDYIEYRNTDPDDFTGYDLIWIRTSQDSTYGKITAFGKTCDFVPGDRLFFRREYFSPGGISGYWIYIIENDSTVSYKLTDYQHDRGVPVRSWF